MRGRIIAVLTLVVTSCGGGSPDMPIAKGFQGSFYANGKFVTKTWTPMAVLQTNGSGVSGVSVAASDNLTGTEIIISYIPQSTDVNALMPGDLAAILSKSSGTFNFTVLGGTFAGNYVDSYGKITHRDSGNIYGIAGLSGQITEIDRNHIAGQFWAMSTTPWSHPAASVDLTSMDWKIPDAQFNLDFVTK